MEALQIHQNKILVLTVDFKQITNLTEKYLSSLREHFVSGAFGKKAPETGQSHQTCAVLHLRGVVF